MTGISRIFLAKTLSAALLAVTSLAACGGGDAAPLPLANRLWLSKLPTKTTEVVGALVILQQAEGKAQVGALYHGSLYRGGHEVFEWLPEDEHHARLRPLQDGKAVKIRLEDCKPDLGFQACVLLHGDPSGVVRYQTRKRWGVRGDAGALDLAAELRALAEDDPDLAALALNP